MGMFDAIKKTFASSSALAVQGDVFMGEIATGVDDIYRRWSLGGSPYNPDLLAIKKGGLPIYKKMREDDQIKACLQLKKAAVVSAGYEVKGDNEEHTEFIEDCIEMMDGTMEGFITSMLSAFDYGFSLHEKVFQYFEFGKNKGKIGLKNLKAKSPTRIDFVLDNYGNLKYMTQKQSNGVETILPPDKFVLFSYQKEFDNYYGESDLKSIYRQWYVKQEVLKYWAIYLERFSIPITIGKLLSGKVTDSQRTSFKELLNSIMSGSSALLPSEMTMNILESARTDRGVFDQAIQSLNIAIARGILVPQLVGLVPQQGVGSYGKSETDLKTFDWVLGTIGKTVADEINGSIFKQLIDINFGPQEEYPEIRLKPIKEEDKARMVAAWSEAVARGAVTPTIETQAEIRKLLSFPEMTEEETSNVEDAMELLTNPPQPMVQGKGGNSGLAGGPSKTSNIPGKQNQYAMSIPGPEARADWEKYVSELDGIEEEARKELTDAFVVSMNAMIADAKKNSTILNGSYYRKPVK